VSYIQDGEDGPRWPGVAMPFDIRRIRFLFSDGETLDVLTPYTDSRVSEFAFAHHFGRSSSTKTKPGQEADRVVGSADLGTIDWLDEWLAGPVADG